MNVTVVGSGNGGLATAFDFAVHGHTVRLFDSPHFPDHVAEVAAAGGIHATGEIEGFAEIAYSGHDIEDALEGAELVVLVGPAYSTEHQAAVVAPHLVPGQAVLVCPASCAGAITFKRTAGLALDDETITVGETSTLPYAVRIVAPGRINVFHKLGGGVFVAGLPRSGTDRLLSMIQDVYPGAEAADCVFQTTLQNGNPVIHPAVTLLNAGLIERTTGVFLFYEEGVTEAVGRAIEAVDRERLAIADALGVRVLSEPDLGVLQGYMRGHCCIKGRPRRVAGDLPVGCRTKRSNGRPVRLRWVVLARWVGRHRPGPEDLRRLALEIAQRNSAVRRTGPGRTTHPRVNRYG